MADPFVAEIRLFGFNFAPKGWAMCNGQLLPISQNTALFSLLGTTYGGDGKSTFALPNLQSRVPMGTGQGQGLTLRDLGETGGTETVTLLISQMPVHTHAAACNSAVGNQYTPPGFWAKDAAGNAEYNAAGASAMNAAALDQSGGDLPHTNMQPYCVVNYCIALQGVFPPRS
ncbi:MAG TPA: tail fiber protein [Vicinamibacterales bacterium]|jgi:microcystin-dependent protein